MAQISSHPRQNGAGPSIFHMGVHTNSGKRTAFWDLFGGITNITLTPADNLMDAV